MYIYIGNPFKLAYFSLFTGGEWSKKIFFYTIDEGTNYQGVVHQPVKSNS